MKRIFLLFGIIAMLSDCKNNDDSPASVIQNIVGRWRLAEYETTKNGEKVWVKADSTTQPSHINVDNNGLILNDQGYLPCCPPEWLTINGNPFKIIRKEVFLPSQSVLWLAALLVPILKYNSPAMK